MVGDSHKSQNTRSGNVVYGNPDHFPSLCRACGVAYLGADPAPDASRRTHDTRDGTTWIRDRPGQHSACISVGAFPGWGLRRGGGDTRLVLQGAGSERRDTPRDGRRAVSPRDVCRTRPGVATGNRIPGRSSWRGGEHREPGIYYGRRTMATWGKAVAGLREKGQDKCSRMKNAVTSFIWPSRFRA